MLAPRHQAARAARSGGPGHQAGRDGLGSLQLTVTTRGLKKLHCWLSIEFHLSGRASGASGRQHWRLPEGHRSLPAHHTRRTFIFPPQVPLLLHPLQLGAAALRPAAGCCGSEYRQVQLAPLPLSATAATDISAAGFSFERAMRRYTRRWQWPC